MASLAATWSRLNFDELYVLLHEHLGYVVEDAYVDSEEQTISCVLFESFEFVCGLDRHHGSFGAAVHFGRTQGVSSFLGKPVSMHPDEKSIRASLDEIVAWCRLQLTDKFLAAFEAAHSNE